MKPRILLGLLVAVGVLVQAYSASATPIDGPTTLSTPDSTASDLKDKDSDDSDKPFVPYWAGQVDMSYSNQPASWARGKFKDS